MRFEEKMVFGKPASVSCGLDTHFRTANGHLSSNAALLQKWWLAQEHAVNNLLFQNCT
jgi:hypothetical protein